MILTLVLYALICIGVPVLGISLLWTQRRQEKARRAAGQYHPEEYERVPCDLCNGTGGGRGLLTPEEAIYPGNRCPRCHGQGWLMVKKDPEELRDTPPKATVADSEAPRATPGSSGEVPEDERHIPEIGDAPTAPTVPTAPDGMDDII